MIKTAKNEVSFSALKRYKMMPEHKFMKTAKNIASKKANNEK